MRCILCKIAENQTDWIGDIIMLADPTVVEALVKEKQRREEKNAPLV